MHSRTETGSRIEIKIELNIPWYAPIPLKPYDLYLHWWTGSSMVYLHQRWFTVSWSLKPNLQWQVKTIGLYSKGMHWKMSFANRCIFGSGLGDKEAKHFSGTYWIRFILEKTTLDYRFKCTLKLTVFPDSWSLISIKLACAFVRKDSSHTRSVLVQVMTKQDFKTQGTVSISDKTSYGKISWSLEAARSAV